MNSYEELLRRLQAAQTESQRALITHEFHLETQPNVVRNALDVAAILHWFDLETLNALLGTPLSEEEFNALLLLPYIEEFPERGWNVHEKTRDLIRDQLWKESNGRYRELSRYAAAWFRKYHSSDLSWRIESIYHALHAKERNAEESFINFCIALCNDNQFDMHEALVRLVLNAVQAGRLGGGVAAWALCQQALICIRYSRYREAEVILNQALNINCTDKFVIANCLKRLGDSYMGVSDWLQARKRFKESLVLFSELKMPLSEANCIRSLGDVHVILSELPQAKKSFDVALKIYRNLGESLGQANTISSLGDVYKAQLDWSKAARYYEQARKIFSMRGDRLGDANCLRDLGEVHSVLLEFPQALKFFEAALTIYREIGERGGAANCLLSLGQVHLALSDFPRAGECYKSAESIYGDIGSRLGQANCIHLLGEMLGEAGDSDSAVKYILDATQCFENLGMTDDVANCYETLGRVYFNEQNYLASIEVFNKSIDIFPEVTNHIGRAKSHIFLGDFCAAEHDLQMAAAFNQKYEYLYFNLARLALFHGQLENALELFDKALAKVPESGEFHLWRAFALAMNDCPWEDELEIALNRVYLVRQIKEGVLALEMLVQFIDANLLEKLSGKLKEMLSR